MLFYWNCYNELSNSDYNSDTGFSGYGGIVDFQFPDKKRNEQEVQQWGEARGEFQVTFYSNADQNYPTQTKIGSTDTSNYLISGGTEIIFDATVRYWGWDYDCATNYCNGCCWDYYFYVYVDLKPAGSFRQLLAGIAHDNGYPFLVRDWEVQWVKLWDSHRLIWGNNVWEREVGTNCYMNVYPQIYD
jgi:hypothetical protein